MRRCTNTSVPDTNPPSSFGSRQSSSGWLSEFKWAPYLFLIPTVGLLFVFSVLPMIYGVWMSLQNVDVVRGTSSFIGLGNYLRLFHDGQFGLSVLNTAWYTLTVVPLIVIGSIAIAVPPAATATGTFMMRQYIVGIHDELLEAARIDGASDWKIYRHIILPLSAPALGAVGILSFTWRWNDYLWPLIVIGDQKNFTLQLSLANLVGTNTVEWGTLLAYATLAMLPVLVVFLCFQRYFLKGSWSGGVKG